MFFYVGLEDFFGGGGGIFLFVVRGGFYVYF